MTIQIDLYKGHSSTLNFTVLHAFLSKPTGCTDAVIRI